MRDLNYVGAIELLNSTLAKGDNSDAKISLAECYRKINDTENAELMYGLVVRLPEAQPIHYLYYGEMLQRNGKCEQAREWYDKFTKAVPEDARGQYLNRACDYEQELKTKGEGVYVVKRGTFNSNLDDFGSTFYKDGIIFASERDKGSAVKRNHCWTGQPFLDLYFVPIKGCGSEVTYGKPEKFSNDINSKYHDAIVTFNGESIFFTRNNYSGGKTGKDDQGIMRLKIYTSKKKGNGFSSEESLPFNSDEYSCAHPTVNADGTKLYFASDMPGGFGGMDLYVSELENGRWGPPMNMGPGINTEGNEVFPFIHKSGRMYFSSDGNLGLGGYDIYYVDDKGTNLWTAPENLGAPINSKDDDFGITLNDDGTCGFFSSDRAGGSGRDDIYSFTKTATPVTIYVYDAATKEPIENAMVTSDSCTKKTLKTGKNGKVSLDVKFNTCCTYNASFEGYEKSSKEGCVKDAASVETNMVEIPLTKVQKFTLEGIVFDQSTGLPLGGAKVTLMGKCKDSMQTFTTDASGKYNFKISPDCCYKVKGEKEKYFAATSMDTLCTKGNEGKMLLYNINLQPAMANPNAPTNPGDVVNGGPSSSKPGVVRYNTDGTVTTTYPDGTTTTTTGSAIDPMHPTDGSMATTDGPKGSKTNPKRGKEVYYDGQAGVYMDPKTRKPAKGKHNGIVYKDGQIVDDPNSTVFHPAPGTGENGTSTYTDGNPSYLLHVYYDFDQSYLRDESAPELNKLLKLLTENPSYIVELASHTDSRGSNNYNNRLSQRRAESVVRWLVDHGIQRDRLVPRGYGESMLSNNCSNNIPCKEQQHQMNRRTEFRVLGCKDCVDSNTSKLSRPNENAKVDKCKGCPF
jgi:outer membrane protein OmpA-like peptidoglycan-associated protein